MRTTCPASLFRHDCDRVLEARDAQNSLVAAIKAVVPTEQQVEEAVRSALDVALEPLKMEATQIERASGSTVH